MKSDNRVLLIGYGNPGRLDDGLGPALAEAVEKLNIPGVNVEADYQLTVEDASAIAQHDVVIFADADVSGPEPFRFEKIGAAARNSGFSSHAVEPAEALSFASDIFGAEPRAYALGIRGYQFNGFGERLSQKAEENLAAALSFVERKLKSGEFSE